MSRNFILYLSILISFATTGCEFISHFSSTSLSSSNPDFISDEVIVSLKPKARTRQIKIASQFKSTKKFRAREASNLDRDGRFLKLKLEAGESVNAAIARLEKMDEIEFVQPNYVYHTMAMPNDPYYAKLWGLKNSGQTITGLNASQDEIRSEGNPGTSNDDISAEQAWDVISDCSSVTVAVLDTGVKVDHEDVVNNLWTDSNGDRGYDFIDNDNIPNDFFFGHGTHVSTIIAAEGNNGKGTVGVCWKARIMPVRVCDNSGSCSSASVIAGISYAKDHSAKIINMSFAGPAYDPAEASAMGAASDILFVIAAGNNGTDNSTTPYYPCNDSLIYQNIICVAAVNQDFSLASYSNYSSITSAIQIAAPGTNILASTPSAISSTAYDFLSENFSSSWFFSAIANTEGGTTTPHWGYGTSTLQNPTNYNGVSSVYSNGLNSFAYKNFSNQFTGYKNILWEFDLKYALADTSDSLEIAFDRSNIDLFSVQTPYFQSYSTVGPKNTLASFRHSNDSSSHDTYIDISSICGYQFNCSVGFKLSTDSMGQSYGIQVSNMQFIVINDAYKILSGTSMATPHVTGVAALVWAYNPQFTVTEVKNALLNGGKLMSGLSGKVSTSRVLNAMGSLAYISKPAAPTITIK